MELGFYISLAIVGGSFPAIPSITPLVQAHSIVVTISKVKLLYNYKVFTVHFFVIMQNSRHLNFFLKSKPNICASSANCKLDLDS